MSGSRKHLIVVMTLAFVLALTVLAGCSPREGSDDDNGDSAAQSASITWSPNSDCKICHTAQAAGGADTAAGAHASVKAVKCVSCHTDIAGLETVHKGVSMGQAMVDSLKATKVESAACTASGCHSDTAARKTATAGSTKLTDANGKVVNPHDLPSVGEHSTIGCSSCHTGHKAMVPKRACLSCHHKDVFQCGTCHPE